MDSSSPPPRFPAEGDVFASLDDFKRAAYRYSLYQQTKLFICGSEPGVYCKLRCPLGGGKTNSTSCAHQLKCCDQSEEVGPGEYEVVESEEGHTCSKSRRHDSEERESARQTMQYRLNRLATRPAPPTPAIVAPDTPVQIESDDEVEIVVKLSPKTAEAASPSWSSLYPPAKELTDGISLLEPELASSFPSPNESFDSARCILTRLHAAAHYCGFTIYRKKAMARRAVLICSKGRARYPQQCPFRLEVLQGDDGQWKLGDTDYQHNHAVLAGQGRTVDLSCDADSDDATEVVAAKRRRMSTRTSIASRYAPFSTSSSSSIPHGRPLSPPVVSQPRRPQLPSPTPTTSKCSPAASFLAELECFLASITTSSAVALTAPLLLKLGLDSVDKLTFLLSLSDFSLTLYIDNMVQQGLPKLASLLLRKGLLEARRRCAEGS